MCGSSIMRVVFIVQNAVHLKHILRQNSTRLRVLIARKRWIKKTERLNCPSTKTVDVDVGAPQHVNTRRERLHLCACVRMRARRTQILEKSRDCVSISSPCVRAYARSRMCKTQMHRRA